jgi:PAS domain S-box-containing protein
MPTRLSSVVKAIANWWAQRTLAQRFATLTAVLIAGAAIVQGAVLIGFASQVVGDLERERVEQRLDKAATQFTSRVKDFRKVPQILGGTPPIARIVALSLGERPQIGESLDEWLRRLGIIFRSILQANPDLTQARFIGVADGGRELVRVNRVGDSFEIVDQAHLQRKGDRPYFKNTAKLRSGEVYLSAIDANVENGAVVKPYETTIRAGTPVFTERGEFFGIIVANANANSWLHELSELGGLSGASGRVFAANQNGDYVYRSDGGPLFGSFSGSKDSFARDWPALRPLFSPDAPETIDLREGKQFLAADRIDYNPGKPDEFLVLATDVDASTVFADTWSLVLLGSGVALAMALIGLVAAYFVARPLKELMSAARQIAAGKIDIASLTQEGRGADIGELGEALRIMQQAVESRETSLRKSEAHLQAIVDNTIDGLITIDRHGIILRYNRGCEDIFGYSIDEAIGQNVSILMPRKIGAEHDSYMERYARTGEKRFIGVRREATGRHKDGRPIDLEVAIAELKVGADVVFSGIVRDITERKKVERIKSEFVSTVTHELRTPLTSIMGSIGLLRSGSLGRLSEKAARMTNLAHDNGLRLVNLINDILDIDKIEAGQLVFKRQPENLTTLLEKAAEQNAAYAHQHGTSILVEPMPNDVIIETDPDRFQQVMGNLLSNAAKFSPTGAKIRIGATMGDGVVRVSVADEGPGIPVAFRDRIFSKFAQADSSDTREKGGTGLGLSICKAIIKRMDGRIGFETQEGRGTTFYFDLPAHRDADVPVSAEPTPPPSDKEGRVIHVSPKQQVQSTLPRVLHVEDDADTCAVVAECIADVAQVTAVSSAEEARDILSENSFDLVILDMLLPGENGDSVLRFLLERSKPPPPVLVFSGLEMAVERWPPVTRALVKARTDIVTLRNTILELLNRAPPPAALKRSA